MTAADQKSERIELRTTARVKDLLQRAAAASHKNVTEFMVDAAVEAAEDALAGRRAFRLDEERWRAFEAALDRPATAKPELAALLRTPGVLD